MRSFVGLLILFLFFQAGAVFHKNARTTQVHTPFRWVFADSAEMATESVTADDTDKVAYRLSDSSVWVLRDNSPKTWIQIADGRAVSDSVNAVLGRFDSVGVGTAKADSIDIGTAGFIRCDTGSFPCTSHVQVGSYGVSVDTIGIAYWQKIGNIITVLITSWTISLNANTEIIISNFPDSLTPATYSQRVQTGDITGYGGTVVLNEEGSPNAYITTPTSETTALMNPSFTYILTQ